MAKYYTKTGLKSFPTGACFGISCRNNEEPSQTSAKAFCRVPATLAAPRVNILAAQPPSTGLLRQDTHPPGVPRYFIQGPLFMSSHQHRAKCATPLLWQRENLLLPLKRTRERNDEIQSLQKALKVTFQRHLQALELFLCTRVELYVVSSYPTHLYLNF